MARPSANLRLFVGVYPPEELTSAAIDALDALELPAHRRTAAGQVHLTLQFIGDVPAKQLDETIESVQRSTGGIGPFTLAWDRLIALPERGRRRLIAATTDAPPGLLEIQRRLAQRLAKSPRRKPGDRFLPHLTLARFVAPMRMEAVDHPLDLPAFDVTSIHLMRSTLQPDGAVHHEVDRFTLGA